MLTITGLVTFGVTASFAQIHPYNGSPNVQKETDIHYLKVSGNKLMYNGEEVFLSGMNIAWFAYGYDFGNDHYDCSADALTKYMDKLPSDLRNSGFPFLCSGPAFENDLRRIAAAGGNAVRVWLHADGRDTPHFDWDGFAISPDREGSFINDLSRLLDVAAECNIFVILVLWNGAQLPEETVIHLMWDDSKLDRYIAKVLLPTVNALKTKEALAAWEIINEPEGSLNNSTQSADPCFDGTRLKNTGAGWTGAWVPVEKMLRFINRQIAAIKGEDPKALATIGSWSERTQTNSFGFRDFYTDSCLISAGGKSLGTIDFYQMHTYANDEGHYSSTSPMNKSNSDYNLNKPNIIGEYSQDGGDGRHITDLHKRAYEHGYSGALTWQANGGGHHADNFNTQARALYAIANRTDHGKIGVRIDGDPHPGMNPYLIILTKPNKKTAPAPSGPNVQPNTPKKSPPNPNKKTAPAPSGPKVQPNTPEKSPALPILLDKKIP